MPAIQPGSGSASLSTLADVASNNNQVPNGFVGRTYRLSSILGLDSDFNMTTGQRVSNGAVPTLTVGRANADKINTILATATATSPVILEVDVAVPLAKAISIPDTGHVALIGRGRDTGFRWLPGSNCNGIQSAICGVTNLSNQHAVHPGTPHTFNGQNVLISDLTIWHAKGNYPNGLVSTSAVDGTIVGYDGALDGRGLIDAFFYTTVILIGVRTLRIQNVFVYDPTAYSINLYKCENFDIVGCDLRSANPGDYNNFAGVQLQSGCTNGRISNCYISGGDDAIAINLSEDFPTPGGDIVVSDCHVEGATLGRVFCLSTAGVGGGAESRRVIFQNITGTVSRWGLIVGHGEVYNDANPDSNHSVIMDNCELSVTDGGGAMLIVAANCGLLEMRSCRMIEPTTAAPLVKFSNQLSAVSCLRLIDCGIHRSRLGSGAATFLQAATSGSAIGHLEVSGCYVTEQYGANYTDISGLVSIASMPVNSIKLSGRYDGVGTVLNIASSATVGGVYLGDLWHSSNAGSPASYTVVSGGGSVPVYVEGWKGTNVLGLAAANVTLSGPGLAGISLPGSIVADGQPYLSAPHSNLPAVKVGGVVKLYTIATAGTLAPGTATAGSTTTTTVAATATDASGGTSPYAYQWFRSTSSGTLGSAVSGQTTRTLADTGLTPGTTYYYTLRYTDAASAVVTSNQVAAATAAGLYALDDSFVGSAATALVGHAPESGTTWANDTGHMYPASDFRLTGDGYVYNNRSGPSLILSPTTLSASPHVLRARIRFMTNAGNLTIPLYAPADGTHDCRFSWDSGVWGLSDAVGSPGQAYAYPGNGTVVDLRITATTASSPTALFEVSTNGGTSYSTLFGGPVTFNVTSYPFAPGIWMDVQTTASTGVQIGHLTCS